MDKVLTPIARSFNMSRIRKINTKPEILVRKFLFHAGFRFRIHVKTLPGTPDIVLKKYKTAIFINGCLWHAHNGCRLNRPPKSRQEYWLPKITRNVTRDIENKVKLASLGWTVATVWECELKKDVRGSTLRNLLMLLSDYYWNEIY
jgi:DNA mismatch endonuclease (patch repair protein)